MRVVHPGADRDIIHPGADGDIPHPDTGGDITRAAAEIFSMPDAPSRFQHVCRHLYRRIERWDLIVPGLPVPPSAQAQCAGCPCWLLTQARPDFWGSSDACQAHVLADHDRFLEPAYRSALESALRAGRWGRWAGDRGAEAYVGDNGVLVIVNRIGRLRKPQVSSAYRVLPLGLDAMQATAQDFFEAAVRKLRDRSSYRQEEGGPK